MYVCLCNGYRDTQLRELAHQGFTAAVDAFTALGRGPCCGQCVDFAQEIMDEAGHDRARALSPAE